MDDDAEMLAKIIIESDSVMIITIDGFWQGTVLYRTKYTVDEAVERSEKVGKLSPHFIMVDSIHLNFYSNF